MLHLRSVHFRVPVGAAREAYPFRLPFVAAEAALTFTAPVTILVGENGAGKSTVLEAVAAAAGLVTAGAAEAARDHTLAGVHPLADSLRLTWNKRTRKGFFLRAEDFFGYVQRVAQGRAGLAADAREVADEFRDRSAYARDLALGPLVGEGRAWERRYGDLEARSHGESFLDFFQARFVPGGLYLLDEPEAPLSPLRQIALLTLLHQLTAQAAQFIIATHSPILMALPGALLLDFDQTPPQPTAYASLGHVRLTRDFLAAPERFLRHLTEPGADQAPTA